MIIMHPTSLSETIDFAAEALFYQKSILPPLRDELTTLILSRQVQSGSNAGYFIPFASGLRSQSRLFTGETMHTEFASRNLLLIESVKLLTLLALDDPAVNRSIRISDQRMHTQCYSQFCSKGECKALTIAYMRNLAVSSSDEAYVCLDQFLTQLIGYRDGKGKWYGFPFFYTLLMLSETDRPLAAEELEYATPTFERLSRQVWPNDRYSKRCQSIVEKISARSEHHAYPLLLGQ
jgi:hypothetical protein